MTISRITVPAIVRAKAAVDGDGGQAWADALPAVLATLEQRWSVRIGEQLDGGTSSVVARAATASGTPVVIKVAVPTPDFDREVQTLQLADGRGYVRLLAHDAAQHAVLLEQLGQPISRLGLSPAQQLSRLAAVVAQIWAIPRPYTGELDGWPGEPVDKAAALAALISDLDKTLGHPCPERVLGQALDCADQRSAAFDADRAVAVHGDAAAANLMEVAQRRPGAETGFVFVDPSTFLGDPAYDLGVALRDWCPELLAGDAPRLARRWCRLLASAGGVDETAVWQWGYLERVSTGLYVMSLTGAQHSEHLLSAAALGDAGPGPVRTG